MIKFNTINDSLGSFKVLQCLYFERLPPPSCPTTLKIKLNLKQRLIKSFYLRLLVPVKHWGRETAAVSDWRSVLQASNCVHAGYIPRSVGPLLLLLASTFSLSPHHQRGSFHPPAPLMSLSSFCPHLFLPWLLLFFVVLRFSSVISTVTSHTLRLDTSLREVKRTAKCWVRHF